MGVYINMEMPQSCDDCRLNNGITCYAVPEYTEDGVVGRTEGRPDWCPLVSVPKHGRLVDADANLSVMRQVLDNPYTDHGKIDTAMLKACITMFEEAPTIVPAEEEQSGNSGELED